MLTMRDRADVEEEYARAVAKLDAQPSTYEYVVMSAVRDSLAWVLGFTDVAPWTGRVMPSPGAQQLFSEWALCRCRHNAHYAAHRFMPRRASEQHCPSSSPISET